MRNLACFQTHVLTVHRRCAAGLLVISLSVEWITESEAAAAGCRVCLSHPCCSVGVGCAGPGLSPVYLLSVLGFNYLDMRRFRSPEGCKMYEYACVTAGHTRNRPCHQAQWVLQVRLGLLSEHCLRYTCPHLECC